MRIATTQMHTQALQSMLRQQAKVQQTELQIASGLSILKPSDDPVGAVKVLNLGSNIGTLEQYERNSAQAKSALGYQETVLTTVNDSLQRIRELTVQANNPALHASARASIANEMQQQLNALVAAGNSRDASGEYLFAGYRVDTPPFSDSGAGIVYNGDQGQRMVAIGEGAQVAVRDPGSALFMQVPGGDGRVQVVPGTGNGGSLVVQDFGGGSTIGTTVYTMQFTQLPGQPLQWSIEDDALPVPNVVSSGPYVDGATIAVGGASFRLGGTPVAGDTVTIGPAQPQSMFALVGSLVTALDDDETGAAAQARLQNALTQGLAGLDQALASVNNQRAVVGARLGQIEGVESINQDLKLQLESVLSATQDLDYAEAITRFNLQLSSLQAAQQAYMKTSGLSLFQYL